MPILIVAMLVLLSACASMAQQEQPAVIIEPTEQSYAELVSAISDALHGAPVTVAKDALTKESLLFIERTPARDATGQRFNGRDLSTPEQFQLVKTNGECVLVHSSTGGRTTLKRTRCVAVVD